MKLKLTIVIENDETGEVLAKSESYGWSRQQRGMFENAEMELGKLERIMELKNNLEDAEDYMEKVADEQTHVTGHVQ
jgi:hypothetical protein